MKIFNVILVAGFPFASLFASPVYYTFEGSISSVSSPEYTNVAVGDYSTYTFLVDRNSPGIDIHHQIEYYQQSQPENNYEAFFVEYVMGTAEEGGYFGGDVYYFGTQYTVDENVKVQLLGSVDSINGYQFTNDNWGRVQLRANSGIDSWVIGQDGFDGFNLFRSITPLIEQREQSVWTHSNMTLIGISDQNPMAVPEPNSMALLSLGAVFIIGYQCKKKQRG